jgi:hypothetical protein
MEMFGLMCLAVCKSPTAVRGGTGDWDVHYGLRVRPPAALPSTDRPFAGLVKNLKQSRLLDETLVVWGTEFVRTPGAPGADGCGQHANGFTVWPVGVVIQLFLGFALL